MSESPSPEPPIVEVWRNNLDKEFEEIMKIIDTHTVIGMDTEFPGEVFSPGYTPSGNHQYDKVKINVDHLSLIQLGLTFATPSNAPTKSTRTWQFNFYFNTELEYYQEESIKLLKNAGIDLENHRNNGIDTHLFGEYLTTSGIVCNEKMTWTTFHASYDFGYLLKVLTNNTLPRTEAEFVAAMKLFFPVVYDLKVMTQTKQGLNKLADDYKVPRHGIMHQAGSDSLLTVETFQTYVDTVLNGTVDEQFMNQIAGLKSDWAFSPATDFPNSSGRGPGYHPFKDSKTYISNSAHIPPDSATRDQTPHSHSLQAGLNRGIPHYSINPLFATAPGLGSSQVSSLGPPSNTTIPSSADIFYPGPGSPSPTGATGLPFARSYPIMAQFTPVMPPYAFPGPIPHVGGGGLPRSGPMIPQVGDNELHTIPATFMMTPPELTPRSAGQPIPSPSPPTTSSGSQSGAFSNQVGKGRRVY